MQRGSNQYSVLNVRMGVISVVGTSSQAFRFAPESRHRSGDVAKESATLN